MNKLIDDGSYEKILATWDIDFGLVGGKPQIYEINNNPFVDLSRKPEAASRRKESSALFRQNYLQAMADIVYRLATERSPQINRILNEMLVVIVPVIVTFTIAGLWHGAGWTFVLFGLVHGLALGVNHAWREAKLPAPPKVVAWALTMLVVVAALVFQAAFLAFWALLAGAGLLFYIILTDI